MALYLSFVWARTQNIHVGSLTEMEIGANKMTKVIKTEAEYEAALAEIENLMDIDPDPGTPEADQLELLALLVGDFESKRFEIAPPDAIKAIKFRMEQQDLIQRDLVP